MHGQLRLLFLTVRVDVRTEADIKYSQGHLDLLGARGSRNGKITGPFASAVSHSTESDLLSMRGILKEGGAFGIFAPSNLLPPSWVTRSDSPFPISQQYHLTRLAFTRDNGDSRVAKDNVGMDGGAVETLACQGVLVV